MQPPIYPKILRKHRKPLDCSHGNWWNRPKNHAKIPRAGLSSGDGCMPMGDRSIVVLVLLVMGFRLVGLVFGLFVRMGVLVFLLVVLVFRFRIHRSLLLGLDDLFGDIGHLAPNLGLGGGASALVVEDHAAVGVVVSVTVLRGGVPS